MKKYLTIQQMAKATNLSVHTLRYYEKIGLLKAISRSSSGHRQYSPNDQDWMAFVMRLRATGMSIGKMQQFAQLRSEGDTTIEQRRAILEEHLNILRKRIIELHNCEEVLTNKIQYYKNYQQNLKPT